jgi:NAD(P)-dependent dehydrogenase (short-subunit alcohol dehydrogenase family)
METGRNLAIAAGVGIAAALLAAGAARRARRIDLQGRVALITGGGRGLGRQIAEELLGQGCKLAICGRDAAEIADATAAMREQGGDVFGEACDASEPDQVNAFVQRVIERFGRIDVLVNNAGQCFVGPATALRPEHMEDALRNIFWVQYYPTMAVLPHMRWQGFGRIVCISSIGGKIPTPHQAAYVAGKYAVTGWAETLAAELAAENIRVSVITPPPLRNGAALFAHFNGQAEKEFLWFTGALNMPVMSSNPRRVARVVADAARHGDSERAVSAFSWLASRTHGLAPNLTSAVMKVYNRLLPRASGPGSGTAMRLGRDIAERAGCTQPDGGAPLRTVVSLTPARGEGL